jgi:hypothetical protein
LDGEPHRLCGDVVGIGVIWIVNATFAPILAARDRPGANRWRGLVPSSRAYGIGLLAKRTAHPPRTG